MTRQRNSAVWGTKFGFASARSALIGHRVILGLQHVPQGAAGGEVAALVELALDAAARLPGVNAFVADGAMRGAAINHIQTTTGVPVVSPPRPRDRQHGGIKVHGRHYAAKTLPASKARTRAFAGCGGHELWAAAGGIHERIITSDGTATYAPVTAGQQKWQRKKGAHALYVKQTMTCAHTGATHTWWEPYTAVGTDAAAGFNRAEYLRAIPRDDPDYARVYGMRADTESLHAQLEFAFHKQRLPAWGAHRQTLVVLLAAMAHNAWALHVWNREVARQHPPPDREAA